MRFLHPWDFLGKNTGVRCHFLLQQIFPTQGLKLGLQHCKQTILLSESPGKLPSSVLSVQQSDSVTHTHTYIFFFSFFSIIGYYKILNVPVLYSRPLFICFIYS